MIIVYGLKNCDTCRKAVKWLNYQGKNARLQDLRTNPVELEIIERWITQMGWKTLLNCRSKTWRSLPPAMKQNINAREASGIMLAHPTIIKRPVFVYDKGMLVGFSDKTKAILEAID